MTTKILLLLFLALALGLGLSRNIEPEACGFKETARPWEACPERPEMTVMGEAQ